MIDDIKVFLPKSLSPSSEEKLFQDLESFSNGYDNQNWYLTHLVNEPELYQGDLVDNLPFNFIDHQIIGKGLLISNTCDMALDNEKKRIYDSYIMYAPLFDINKYQKKLLEKYDLQRITNHIDQIKNQKTTNTMYFKDYNFFARLDMLQSISIGKYLSEILKNRINCLSQFSWYLMLYKISIHFCRMQEGLDRDILVPS